MPIYVLEKNSGILKQTIDLYWLCIMFLGYPIVAIFEWIHWEIYGSGPKRKN